MIRTDRELAEQPRGVDDSLTHRMKRSNRRTFDSFDRLAEAFKIISNRSVARVIETLRHREMSISAIAGEIAVKPKVILRHVQMLKGQALLSSRRRSGVVLYSLAGPLVEALDLVRAISIRQLEVMETMSVSGRDSRTGIFV